MTLSAVIIALNEQDMIEGAIASCSFSDEVLVVDGGSSDGTVNRSMLGEVVDANAIIAAFPGADHKIRPAVAGHIADRDADAAAILEAERCNREDLLVGRGIVHADPAGGAGIGLGCRQQLVLAYAADLGLRLLAAAEPAAADA